jgi:hypothetical protein
MSARRKLSVNWLKNSIKNIQSKIIGNDQPSVACTCRHADGLFLSRQHTSWVAASLLLIGFFVFIAGYFLGQQKAVEQFSMSVDQESLSDKIYSSLYSSPEESSEELQAQEEGDNTESESSDTAASDDEADTASSVQSEESSASQESALQAESTTYYYAELAGFGSIKNAQAFARKLEKKGIMADVRTRYSKTARGRTIAWYQVITANHDSREKLQELVDRLKHEERLQDVRIVAC